LNFAPLENGAEAYARAAQRYRQAVARLNESNGAVWDSPALREINAKLLLTERTFIVNQGLKERPWFKHQIYAPGAYTGYGAKTIPAVREAMEENKWQDADQGAVLVGQVLMNEASLVDSISQELEQAEGQPPASQVARKHLAHGSPQKQSGK
jgi:N-acetylated-alpha-linked acidic dipeptidase